MTAIDSQFCARAAAFQVLEAAKCSAEGLTVAESVPRIQAVKERTLLYICIVNLENMVKGGRIGKTMDRITTLLNIKANLKMIDGALTTDLKGRGTKSIVKRYEEIIAELKQKYSDVEEIGITHDGLSDYSNQIIGMLKNAFP